MHETGAASVFLLLVVGNGVWAWINGRLLADTDSLTRNFLEDWPNLINYALLCPLYVTLGVCFLIHVFDLRECIRRNGLQEALGLADIATVPTVVRNVVGLAVMIVVSIVAMSRYASELARYDVLFWFQEAAPQGAHVLGTHGFYYLISNMVMNALVVAVIAAHFEVFAVSTAIGNRLQALATASARPPRTLLKKRAVLHLFSPIISIYVLSKALIVIFIANMYTWRAQQPGFRGMLELSILILAVGGASVVSYPRYHLQTWLYRLWARHGNDEYPELRRPVVAGFASLADLIILGSAMTSLLLWVLKRLGVPMS